MVDECLKTMYYIQVSYDRWFLKAEKQPADQWLKHWIAAESFVFSFGEKIQMLQKNFQKVLDTID